MLEGAAAVLLGLAGLVAFTLLGVSPPLTAVMPAVATAAEPIGELCKPACPAVWVAADLVTGAALARVGASSTGVMLTAGLRGPAMDQAGLLPWLPLQAALLLIEEHIEPLDRRLLLLLLPGLSEHDGEPASTLSHQPAAPGTGECELSGLSESLSTTSAKSHLL